MTNFIIDLTIDLARFIQSTYVWIALMAVGAIGMRISFMSFNKYGGDVNNGFIYNIKNNKRYRICMIFVFIFFISLACAIIPSIIMLIQSINQLASIGT